MTDLRIDDPNLADLAPSAKLIYLVVREHGPCSLAELRGRLQLSDRTTRRALSTLEDLDAIAPAPALPDQSVKRVDVVETHTRRT